jgi:hypothetical protein
MCAPCYPLVPTHNTGLIITDRILPEIVCNNYVNICSYRRLNRWSHGQKCCRTYVERLIDKLQQNLENVFGYYSLANGFIIDMARAFLEFFSTFKYYFSFPTAYIMAGTCWNLPEFLFIEQINVKSSNSCSMS